MMVHRQVVMTHTRGVSTPVLDETVDSQARGGEKGQVLESVRLTDLDSHPPSTTAELSESFEPSELCFPRY